MRWIVLPLAIIALAGCRQTPDDDWDSAWHRSNVVRSCADGAVITQDPQTHRYLWANRDHYGWVQDGLSPEQVCQ